MARWRQWYTLLRGWRVPSAALVVLLTVAAVSFAPVLVPLPASAPLSVVVAPTASVAALALALAAVHTVHEPAVGLVASAARPVRALALLRVWALASAGAALLASLAGEVAVAPALAVVALTGEGLACAAIAGLRYFWILPVAHLCAAVVLGAANRAQVAPWAWILEPAQSLSTASGSVALAVVGTVLWCRHRGDDDSG